MKCFDLDSRGHYGNYMTVEILAVTEAANNASQVAAKIGVGFMFAVFFAKFIQMVFVRKRKPKE